MGQLIRKNLRMTLKQDTDHTRAHGIALLQLAGLMRLRTILRVKTSYLKIFAARVFLSSGLIETKT